MQIQPNYILKNKKMAETLLFLSLHVPRLPCALTCLGKAFGSLRMGYVYSMVKNHCQNGHKCTAISNLAEKKPSSLKAPLLGGGGRTDRKLSINLN